MNAVAQKLVLAVGIAAIAASCTPTSDSSQTQQSPKAQEVAASSNVAVIKIDGSSTVYPITDAIAKEYQKTAKNTQIEVNFSGTGGGFKKFCAGETDISNASRPISEKEMVECKKNSIGYIELPVAFDALTVVVNPQNDWAKDITTEELKKIWEPAAEGKITRWNQVRASWPDRPITLYGPGKDSGTFDYFTEAVVGKTDASRNDYTASEDDDVLVDGISKDPNALGYFGFAYYEANQSKLKVVPVNNGKGPITPSRETVEKVKYQPLSRPLFIYVNPWSAKNKGAVYKFVDFYLKTAAKTSTSVGYVPLPAEAYQIDYVHLNKGKVGTVFAGKQQLDLTIGELLRKQKQF
ncbi:MAG: PstS family phosphate ABC transporter substrate-binding protein [Goleter apudmare HA4340-LM2]|jgi:phosphate transport system substrate-binding protein|nr:PstS family phosphate ABC transporter substrate-binding protein [Goleter apudmare HA4340-LM2]